MSMQLYRQSANTEGQKEMLFRGLSIMGGFSWFKRISKSFYSENLLLYDRVAFLIFGIVITHIIHYAVALMRFESVRLNFERLIRTTKIILTLENSHTPKSTCLKFDAAMWKWQATFINYYENKKLAEQK